MKLVNMDSGDFEGSDFSQTVLEEAYVANAQLKGIKIEGSDCKLFQGTTKAVANCIVENLFVQPCPAWSSDVIYETTRCACCPLACVHDVLCSYARVRVALKGFAFDFEQTVASTPFFSEFNLAIAFSDIMSLCTSKRVFLQGLKCSCEGISGNTCAPLLPV